MEREKYENDEKKERVAEEKRAREQESRWREKGKTEAMERVQTGLKRFGRSQRSTTRLRGQRKKREGKNSII